MLFTLILCRQFMSSNYTNQAFLVKHLPHKKTISSIFSVSLQFLFYLMSTKYIFKKYLHKTDDSNTLFRKLVDIVITFSFVVLMEKFHRVLKIVISCHHQGEHLLNEIIILYKAVLPYLHITY